MYIYIIYHTWILWEGLKENIEITPAWRCRRWVFSASQMIHLLLLSIKCKIEKLWIVFVSWFGLHPPFLWQFSALKKKVWGFMETAKLHGPHLRLRSSRFFQSLLLCFQGISIELFEGHPIEMGRSTKAKPRWFFTPIWGRFPFWPIFFRWVETTNQKL